MTVKLQNGKVILKDGKVSCSCCAEPECCMYPAQALFDGLYTIDDLPDTIVEYPSDDSAPITFTKLSSPTPSQDPTVGAISYYQGIDQIGSLVGVGLREGNEWVGSEIGNEAAEFGECLISRFLPSLPFGIGDQFADTYTVTINPPDDNAGTYTVTRRSICVWSTQVQESGEPAGLKLSYIDAVIGGGFAYTWEIELDTSYIKDGFANTPTGDYSGGNATVS